MAIVEALEWIQNLLEPIGRGPKIRKSHSPLSLLLHFHQTDRRSFCWSPPKEYRRRAGISSFRMRGPFDIQTTLDGVFRIKIDLFIVYSVLTDELDTIIRI